MPKKASDFKVYDWIIKYCIYAAVFLIPIFFLPVTADILDFNKQAVLAGLSFIAFFTWIIKGLVSGSFEIKWNKMQIVVGSFFLVYLLATVFSIYRYASFWGWPQSSSDSLISIIIFSLIYFLISSVFSKKEVFTSTIVLLVSVFLAEFFGVFQIFGVYLIPFNFAKSASFNTVGSIGALGIFTAVTLPLMMVFLVLSKKWQKIPFAVGIVLAGLALFLINFSFVWWAVIFGSALMMIFCIVGKDFIDARWISLPLFFLAIGVFFIFLKPQIPGLTQKTNEIYLAQNSSFSIAMSSLKERPILGSGPGTFLYDFSKFKNKTLSGGAFWNVTFSQATSKVLTDIATTGVLGFLALVALMALPIFYAARFLFSKEKEAGKWVLVLGLSLSLVVMDFAYFFYNANFTLNFLYFFLLASLVALILPETREFALKSSSPKSTLIITLAFTVVFIVGLGVLALETQRYVADLNYSNALATLQSGNIDNGQKSLEVAASLNQSSDLYYRQLSLIYLSQIQREFQNVNGGQITDQQKKKVEALSANAINAAKISTDINQESAADWANRGYVYQNLLGMVQNADTWAANSYDKALKLDPNNPYLLTQSANVSFISSSNLGKDQQDKKNQLLLQAQGQLEKAVGLNSAYQNAFYSLGLVYDALGRKDKAMGAFTNLQQLNPQDPSIAQILSNLKAGLPALQPPTTQENNPKNSAKTQK